MRGWADRGGALFSTDWRQIDLSPPSPSLSFLLYLFFTKSHSTFPIIFRILSLIDHLSPRCFLTYTSPSSRLFSTHIDLFFLVTSLLPRHQENARSRFRGGGLLDKKKVPYYVWILQNLMHGDGCFGFWCSVQRYFPASGSNPTQKTSMRMDGSIVMRLALFTLAELRVPQTKKRTWSCSVVWLPRKSIMERLISQINYLRL